jgi:prepilin-type N-terminal cleavage/methylation domain-containing protein
MEKLIGGTRRLRADRTPRKTKRRGFTLIEVVCATAVTVIGLVSTFYLVGISTGINGDAKNTAQAYQVAQQEIELIRNMPFATLQPITKPSTAAGTPESRFLTTAGGDDASRPGDSGYPGLTNGLGSNCGLANLRNGRGGVIITNDTTVSADTTVQSQVKHVTVVVRWTEPSGQERSAIVGTIVTLGGMDPQ